MRNSNTSNLYRSLFSSILSQPSRNPREYDNTSIINLIDQLNENHRDYLTTITNLSQLIRPPQQSLTELQTMDISGNNIQQQSRDISGNILYTNTPETNATSNNESFTLNDMLRVSNSLESQIQSLFGSNIPIDIIFTDSVGSTTLTNGVSRLPQIRNNDEYIQRYTRTTRYRQPTDSESENDDDNICPITRTEFCEGDEIMEIRACSHRFKKNALVPWLRNHNTCPVCRISIN